MYMCTIQKIHIHNLHTGELASMLCSKAIAVVLNTHTDTHTHMPAARSSRAALEISS